jgi:DUF218 domain
MVLYVVPVVGDFAMHPNVRAAGTVVETSFDLLASISAGSHLALFHLNLKETQSMSRRNKRNNKTAVKPQTGLLNAGNLTKVAFVPGAGLLEDGKPTPRTLVRAMAAAKLIRLHPDMIVVLAGSKPPAMTGTVKATEAEQMARILEKEGIEPSRMRLETESIDTAGNVVCAAICHLRFLTGGTLYAVTSPFHMARIKYLLNKVLSPTWKIEQHTCAVSENDELKAEFPSRFFQGIAKGDLYAAAIRLFEKGKPYYRENKMLVSFLEEGGYRAKAS